MALVKCKECGERVSSKAKKCPECGISMPGQSLIVRLGVIILCAIVFSIWFSFWGVESSSTSSKKRSGPSVYDAYTMGTQFVQSNLKSPSSAKFPGIRNDAAGASQWEGNIWYAQGYVDSKNSFGAMLRSDWRVYIEYLPSTKKWHLVYMQLGDQIVGVNPASAKLATELAEAEQKARERDAAARQQKAAEEKADQDRQIAERKAAVQKRADELVTIYKAQFKPPASGQPIALGRKNGGVVSGVLKEIQDDAVVVTMGGADLAIQRTELSVKSEARCYEGPYVKYMVMKKIKEETGSSVNLRPSESLAQDTKKLAEMIPEE